MNCGRSCGLSEERARRDRRGWRSQPRIQNSLNLLEQIRETDTMSKAPVIIMSDHTPKNSEEAVKMMRLASDLTRSGGIDYIHKPFPTAGRTLDRVPSRSATN